MPGHIASWTRHTTARWASCSSTQHQLQPPQLHRGPPVNQPCSQWFIIARGRLEASSLHGNAALFRSQHHSTADDKITESKPRPHLSDCTTTFDINKYLYICVWYCSCQSNTILQYLHTFLLFTKTLKKKPCKIKPISVQQH